MSLRAARTWRKPLGALVVAALLFTSSAGFAQSGGEAVLGWTPPSQNDDGSQLTNLASYRVYSRCGTGSLALVATLPASVTTHTVTGLPDGQCFFSLEAVNSLGIASARSNEASKLIESSVEPLADPTTGPLVTWQESSDVMAISYLASSAAVAHGSSGTSIDVTPGTTIPSGAVMLVGIHHESNNTNTAPSAWTPPSGWAQLGSTVLSLGNGFASLAVFYKVAGGSEPSSYTFQWTGGNTYSKTIGFVAYTGADTGTPFGTPATGTDTTSDTTFNIPALTTTAANSFDIVLVGGMGNNGGTNGATFSSWGSSLTERVDSGNGDYTQIGIADALRASAGPQSATTVTSSFSDRSLAFRVELFEGAGVGGLGIPIAYHHYKQLFGAH